VSKAVGVGKSISLHFNFLNCIGQGLKSIHLPTLHKRSRAENLLWILFLSVLDSGKKIKEQFVLGMIFLFKLFLWRAIYLPSYYFIFEHLTMKVIAEFFNLRLNYELIRCSKMQ